MNKDKRNNIKILGTLSNADESAIIANANQIYDANEDKSTQDVSKEHTERIKNLETKEDAMQTTLENITKTGEASAASNVTYNHSDSKLDATNVQQAVDEVSTKLAEEKAAIIGTGRIADGAVTAAKIADGVIVQDTGSGEQSVMSQKAVSDKLSDLPKTITYNYNDFKISHTGIYLVKDSSLSVLTTFDVIYSATRLINIRGCKKIILTSKTLNNSQFKPFGFYDITGKAIYPEYYFDNFAGILRDKEITVPSDAEYVEFRSLTSFLDFKAELVYESDNLITFDLPTKNNEDISLINSLFNDVEMKINENSHKHSGVPASATILKYIFPKCVLKDIYIPPISNTSDIIIQLLHVINGVNDEGFYATIYDSYKISKEDIVADEEGGYKIDKEINLQITKNNTLIGFISSPKSIYFVASVQNYDNETGYSSTGNGSVVKLTSNTRPVCFRATIITKESNIVLSDSIKNIDDSIQGINTSLNALQGQIKEIESSTANVANINDDTPSNSETYSSQKIEERIAEIQNASANVQVVNSEGNSTTNAISQAATTLSLSKRVKIFTNVSEMKADVTLKEGMSCQTLGYYSPEDGGHALYTIKSGKLTENKGSIIALNNGLFASLIFDGVLNVKQWGWNTDFTTPFYNTIPYDITDTLNRIMNYIRTNKLKGRKSSSIIYFPKGVYYIGESINLGSDIILEGQSGSAYGPSINDSSVIITNFPGTVFTGNRFYLKRLTFLGAYKSTTAENDTFVASSPKEISYCSISGYDYVCDSLASVGEIAHCVAWIMGKGVVKAKVNDSFIHHNLLTGSCWNKNQNCTTTAIVLGGCAASCISDNYIDFWTYGIRGSVQMVNMMIANNTIDYCAVGIHVEGCEGCIIQGNNFYHINKSTTSGSGVISNYPEDSAWRTTPWCCINVGSTTKSLSVMGNIAVGSDMFMKGTKATELYAYGNMIRGCGSKYSEQNLQSDVCFVDNKDASI